MKMKHLDLFCASPASTAICSSMDQRAIVSSTPRRHHARRQLGDSKRPSPNIPFSSSSQLVPIDPNNKNRGSSSVRDTTRSDLHTRKTSSVSHDQLKAGSSSNNLLNNETDTHKFFNLLADSDHFKTIHVVPTQENPSSSLNSTSRRTQVVELMVSIHCKGCEGKVRRHISRLEGVTSVNIDLASKKVTVVGDVTPLQVLTSISRVKTAQFWPYAPA
ncbi:protein SODIUM POTASSIUM ROOT DEFECTIVE 2-like [Impatiens glandulifera]|uniref:protein SODIUM POTASSIUM ROOT DEFECTIVE 2-like n=1 Tax=Impatiens glandulifera TaxID=253017 RepID=UPI001FB0DA1E|nr:protein SODIUM POTASSIUM ROOT DEFECTIVE 2-like [Impatiens glandulifera]